MNNNKNFWEHVAKTTKTWRNSDITFNTSPIKGIFLDVDGETKTLTSYGESNTVFTKELLDELRKAKKIKLIGFLWKNNDSSAPELIKIGENKKFFLYFTIKAPNQAMDSGSFSSIPWELKRVLSTRPENAKLLHIEAKLA